MARCKATTKLGYQCRNDAVPGSRYCHVPAHQSQAELQFRRKAWSFIYSYKGPIFGLAGLFISLLSILANITGISNYFTGSNKEDIVSTRKEILKEQKQQYQETKKDLQEILTLLARQIDINRDFLKKEYQFGYALFYTDGSEIFSPREVNNNLDVDWRQARVLSLTDDMLVMKGPSIYFFDEKVQDASIDNPTISLSRHRESRFNIISVSYIQISADILINEGNYVVGVIGIGRAENN